MENTQKHDAKNTAIHKEEEVLFFLKCYDFIDLAYTDALQKVKIE